MIPMGSIGPGPSRDPNEPINENETIFQSFGFELCVVAGFILLIVLLLGFSTYADKQDGKLKLQQIPEQTHMQEKR